MADGDANDSQKDEDSKETSESLTVAEGEDALKEENPEEENNDKGDTDSETDETEVADTEDEDEIGDSVSVSGKSDDSSSDVSLDTEAILNVDPLYFRLTKFLSTPETDTSPRQNIAQILEKINANLEKMNSLVLKFVEK